MAHSDHRISTIATLKNGQIHVVHAVANGKVETRGLLVKVTPKSLLHDGQGKRFVASFVTVETLPHQTIWQRMSEGGNA